VAATTEDCSDLVVDATPTYNTGAFPVKFFWRVASPVNATALNTFLNATNNAVITIPANLLPFGNYTLRVRAFLSKSIPLTFNTPY
jgi:hypothetical protein